MHPLTLRFPANAREREFRRGLAEASRTPSRITFLVVAALFLVYALLDRAILPGEVVARIAWVRFGVTAALAAIAASTWHPAWPRFHAAAIAAATGVSIAGLLLIMRLQGPGSGLAIYAGVGVAILGLATLFRLRVPVVLPLELAAGASWLAIALEIGVSREEMLSGAFFIPTAIALGTLAAYTIERYARHAFLHDRAMQEERARADRLLLNILPASVAERLKRSPERIAERHSAATILFADIADFTPLSSSMEPEDLVAMLDEVFTEFDRIVEEKGLETIKTIGDAYMAVAGVPEACGDHLERVVEAALAMRAVAIGESTGGRPVRIRIGIDTGPVVAGVIGRSKFIYDLWGDAVTTASRMESHGAPGRIHVTRAVVDRLHGDYRLEPRGEIEVKGKGPMETWWLEPGEGGGGDEG
ncbi:MAG TPA: adenylate/guanylate cyclase domain-containing protein [Gemmatimonadota bacterium]|nr:adenylate/guanylate cyclase domain-containing protein [Gemmatimonadota bacterium]